MEVVAGSEEESAEFEVKAAIDEIAPGEGGIVDFLLKTVGIVEVVATEGDEVRAEFHDEVVKGLPFFIGFVDFRGDEAFGADVAQLRVPIRGLNFLDEEDTGFGRGRDKFFDEGAVVRGIGIIGKGPERECAENEGVGEEEEAKC